MKFYIKEIIYQADISLITQPILSFLKNSDTGEVKYTIDSKETGSSNTTDQIVFEHFTIHFTLQDYV